MADNVPITGGAGYTIATDDVSSVHYQVVKVGLGAANAVDMHLDSGQQTMVNSLPVVIASDQSAVLHQPFVALTELGLTELIGINERVDTNEYAASVGVALGGTYSGQILSICLYSTEDGTGAVQQPTGYLYIFDADPTITAGDTAMTAAERVTVLGRVTVAAADWDVDANGGTAYYKQLEIPFHALATLYFSFKLTSATSLNDAAGDDEQLEFNAWYRRES